VEDLGNSVSLRTICGGFKDLGRTAGVIGNMHWNLNEQKRLKVRLLGVGFFGGA